MRVASNSPKSSFHPRKPLLSLFVLSLALFCSACSSDRKPVQSVRGRILVDGRPAAQAQVLFHPVEGGNDQPRPTGQTDDQGYFHLTSYRKGDGAPEGSYNVTVTWFRVFPRSRDEVIRYNALPQRYAAAQTSPLRASVAKGKNELTPLQLYSR